MVSVDGGPANLVISGLVCWRGSLAGKPLQVLTSGFTYDHTYWDFPYNAPTYSHIQAATAAGYATFSYDRLGMGNSDLPAVLPGTMTVANQADVLHQLVQAARQGNLAGTTFTDVVSVGHSLGSAIALYEAGTYQDVDAVVLTANMRDVNPAWTPTQTHPAEEDDKFDHLDLPLEVVTTIDGEREANFYYAPNSLSWLPDIDDDYKSTGLIQEIITIPTAYQPGTAGSITAPVLFVMGEFDLLFCNTAAGFPCDTPQDITDRQAPMLPNAPCVDAVVIEDAGHVLNLHLNSADTFAAVNTYDWQQCSTP